MVVDCRSLIEFCKSFEQYRSMANSLTLSGQGKNFNGSSPNARLSRKRQAGSNSSLSVSSSSSAPLCDRSSIAAVDIVILVLVLGACGFLFTPYFKYMCIEIAEVFPATLILIGEVFYQAPIAYILGAVLMSIFVIAMWEFIQHQARKCDNPNCHGLKKAIDFDIQLESENVIRSMPSSSTSKSLSNFSHEVPWNGSIELGHDHKELEAELKRMAPPNGRAVLVFRSPCGCPTARLEVWGTKKPRKSKK